MEAVEIVLYISVAIIVGGLISGFLLDWDFGAAYSLFKGTASDEKPSFTQVSAAQAATRIYDYHLKCRATPDIEPVRLYVEGTGDLSKSTLFSLYKELGWCDSIQSSEEECGEREDLSVVSGALPRVISLNCSTEGVLVE